MNYVDLIIAKFGGIRAAARELNKPKSTVGSWVERGSIPDSEKPNVLSAGQRMGLEISEVDFFPLDLDQSQAVA